LITEPAHQLASARKILQKLHRLCNQFTILSTTYTDPIIDNHQGCVEITPASTLFFPAVPESHMTVLKEDWKKFLQGRPGDAFSPCIRNRYPLT